MNEFDIQQEMYRKAIEFIKKRYPVGWGGAAVMYTKDRQYLISAALDTIDSNVELCIETGAMCEASKYDLKITHSLCVVRKNEHSDFCVLTPCGICQERLRFWGGEVKVAVTMSDNSLKFVALNELQPYHWTNAFSDIVMFDDKHNL